MIVTLFLKGEIHQLLELVLIDQHQNNLSHYLQRPFDKLPGQYMFELLPSQTFRKQVFKGSIKYVE